VPNQVKKIILITGGIRSGKSKFAQELINTIGEGIRYIATAEVKDKEMEKRVQLHKQNRPSAWEILEEPINIEKYFNPELKVDKTPIETKTERTAVTLIDCVTIWVANLLLQSEDKGVEYWESDNGLKEVELQINNFISSLISHPSSVVLVTNEVGWGGIAMSPLGRVYQDILGWTNQKLASIADEVYFVVSGIPMKIKGSN